MKRLIFILLSLLLLLPLMAEVMTLEQCIDSALAHNISLRQQRNTYEMQRLQYRQQKQNLLPSLSANASQSFAFGRATGADNITMSQNMANTSFGLSTNILLFDGLGMKYRIDEARLNMQASEEETEKLEADLRLNISTMYLQVLLQKELLTAADSQVSQTRLKLQQQQQLVREGRLAEGELYTLQAQLAREELTETEALSNLRLALLDLAQAMDVEYNDDFDIAPVIGEQDELLPTNEEVYQSALQHRPEIRAKEHALEAQQTILKQAKSQYSPTLSAGANVGSGYYHLYGAENEKFGKQLEKNLSSNIGLTLSIPLFDRMQTPNNVTRQKIAIENAALQLEQEKQTLRRSIDQAYYNALAAQSQQQSARKAEESAAEALRYAEKKFEAGRATAYEYSEAKNQYQQQYSAYLQAKYNYLFRALILKYYK